MKKRSQFLPCIASIPYVPLFLLALEQDRRYGFAANLMLPACSWALK